MEWKDALLLLGLPADSDEEIVWEAYEVRLFDAIRELSTRIAVPAMLHKSAQRLDLLVSMEDAIGWERDEVGVGESRPLASTSPIDFLRSYESESARWKLWLTQCNDAASAKRIAGRLLQIQRAYESLFLQHFPAVKEVDAPDIRQMADTGVLIRAISGGQADTAQELIDREVTRIRRSVELSN